MTPNEIFQAIIDGPEDQLWNLPSVMHVGPSDKDASQIMLLTYPLIGEWKSSRVVKAFENAIWWVKFFAAQDRPEFNEEEPSTTLPDDK